MYNIRIQEKTAPPKPQSPSSRPRLLGFLYSARLSPLCSAFSPLLGCALPDHEPCAMSHVVPALTKSETNL